MKRALRLAERGRGWVEPNPVVGCVLVRDGKIIGEGWHHRYGGPHAEVWALASCQGHAVGATAYVTLEPCNHFGKTPPCSAALIQSRVKRVVVGMSDPNPIVSGRGIQELRAAGIRTEIGLLHEEAVAQNAPFAKLITSRRPWVILKWAQSIDGRIATRSGDSRWVSDDIQRAHAHRTRGLVDAVVVGVGTAIRDDPLLTARVGRPRRIATRVILDTHLRTPIGAQLVRTARQTPTLIFCGTTAPARRERALVRSGVEVQRRRLERAAHVSLKAVLAELGDRNATNVLVEGGGRVLGRFFDERLADEFQIYIAPILLGGRLAVGALDAAGVAKVRDAQRFNPTPRMIRLGNGWFLRARANRPSATPVPNT